MVSGEQVGLTRDSEDDATRDEAALIYSPPGFHCNQQTGSRQQAPPLRYRCSGKKEGGATSKQSFSELQVTSKGPIYSYVTAPAQTRRRRRKDSVLVPKQQKF